MGVNCHEREAWGRYLFSDRTDAAKRAWLEDVYAGRVVELEQTTLVGVTNSRENVLRPQNRDSCC